MDQNAKIMTIKKHFHKTLYVSIYAGTNLIKGCEIRALSVHTKYPINMSGMAKVSLVGFQRKFQATTKSFTCRLTECILHSRE